MIYVYIYLAVINIAAAVICAVDKSRAKRRLRRISEDTLWLISVAGGSLGMFIMMFIVRHKTKHKGFLYGMPALIILQFVLILLLTKLYSGHIIP